MKVKNIDRFREELFKNAGELYFSGCRMTRYQKTWYSDEIIKPENKDIIGIRTLENVFAIAKYHLDENYKEVKDAVMYVTVNDEGVDFYEKNDHEQRFQWMRDMPFEDYANRMDFAMWFAIKIAHFAER